MHRLSTVLLCSVLAAQQPATPPAAIPEDLAALADRVGAAHCVDGPVPPVEAIRGLLTIQLLDRTAEQRGQIDLDVRFLDWRRAAGARPVPLIRYEVLDAGGTIVRGQDRDGPWQLVRGEPRDLTGADFVQDLAACEQHTNLARQLLLFLSPADVLRSLQRPSPVRPATLTVRRGKDLQCLAVAGELPAFPLLQQGGADRPVRIEVFVEAATGRVAGLDAFPRQGDSVDEQRGERILLADLRARDGILVPHEIRHLFREAGQLVLKSSVQVLQLSLRPELRPEDFDRLAVARRR
jgi:hypothetical protein